VALANQFLAKAEEVREYLDEYPTKRAILEQVHVEYTRLSIVFGFEEKSAVLVRYDKLREGLAGGITLINHHFSDAEHVLPALLNLESFDEATRRREGLVSASELTHQGVVDRMRSVVPGQNQRIGKRLRECMEMMGDALVYLQARTIALDDDAPEPLRAAGAKDDDVGRGDRNAARVLAGSRADPLDCVLVPLLEDLKRYKKFAADPNVGAAWSVLSRWLMLASFEPAYRDLDAAAPFLFRAGDRDDPLVNVAVKAITAAT
jgi:hypothetical protein